MIEFLAAFLIPCLGGAMTWGLAVGERLGRPHAVAQEFTEYIDANVRLGRERLPEVRPHAPPKPEYLTPLADVLMSEASDDEKRGAIEALARLETPEAVEALRTALANDSAEVRFYAAAALSKLEERLATRQKTLERSLRSRPDDPIVDLELARTYFDYAYYHVVDEARRTDFLERALDRARRAAESGADPGAWLAGGRALLALGRFEEAEALFDRYIEAAPQDARGFLWRAEARFRQGHYRGVHEDCARAKRIGGIPDAVAEAVEMWA